MSEVNTAEVQQHLANLERAWAQAEIPDTPDLDTPLPEGNYRAKVERFAFHRLGNPPELKLRTQFQLIGGPFGGRRESSFHTLQNQQYLGYTKKHLATLGLAVDPVATLMERLGQAVGLDVEIKVKHSPPKQAGGKPFVNVYLVKLLDGAQAAGFQPGPSGGQFMGGDPFTDGNAHPFNDDEDIPF